MAEQAKQATLETFAEEVNRIANESFSAVLAEFEEQHVHSIGKLLDQAVSELVYKSLGFNDSYGRGWSVDNCNQRSGESAVGTFIRARAASRVETFLQQLLDNIPQPSIEIIDAAQEEYQTLFRRYLTEGVNARAKAAAQRYLSDMEDAMLSKLHLELPPVVLADDAEQRLRKEQK